MMHPDDNKRLFLDMQEHPESYSDEQLEAMIEDLDRTQDLEAAWQRFERKNHVQKPTSRRWLHIAAMFAGVLFVAGIAWAAVHVVSTMKQASEVMEVQPSATPVHFDNATLDSILTVVSAHYRKSVAFRDEASRRMKLIMTWQPDASLSDFLERLNAFDGLTLYIQNDTIIVIQTNEGEDEP
jgi:ferric-dicitrate binding protein FerR (iron transport regulator)